MKLTKLTRKQVIAIGIIILVVIGAGGYFGLIKSAAERYQNAVAERNQARDLAQQVPSLEQQFKQVQVDHARAERELNAVYQAKMPYISVRDPVTALGRIWEEYGDHGMGPVLQSWVRSTKNFATGIELPEVRTDPPPRDTKEISVDLDKFGIVTSSFPKLLTFLRATDNMPRLGSIKKLTVKGQSPGLTVEAPMTVYLWTRDFTGAEGGAGTASPETAQAPGSSPTAATGGP
jgi:hypothetical protein